MAYRKSKNSQVGAISIYPSGDLEIHRASDSRNSARLYEDSVSERMVWVPSARGGFCAVPYELLPQDYFEVAAPERVSQASPGFDARAQILAAGGVAAAGVGWGAGQLMSALAGFGTGGLLALALLILAARMRPPTTATSSGPTGSGGGTEVHLHRGAKVRNLHVR